VVAGSVRSKFSASLSREKVKEPALKPAPRVVRGLTVQSTARLPPKVLCDISRPPLKSVKVAVSFLVIMRQKYAYQPMLIPEIHTTRDVKLAGPVIQEKVTLV
jgi:hypothetical protein